MRESAIEKQVCSIARNRGWLAYKWASPNQRGVPDRIFIKNGQILLAEFKAPGKKPTPLQAHIHQKLQQQGINVRVIDSVETGITLFA